MRVRIRKTGRCCEATRFDASNPPWPDATYQTADGFEVRDRGFRSPLRDGDVVLRSVPRDRTERAQTLTVMSAERFAADCEEVLETDADLELCTCQPVSLAPEEDDLARKRNLEGVHAVLVTAMMSAGRPRAQAQSRGARSRAAAAVTRLVPPWSWFVRPSGGPWGPGLAGLIDGVKRIPLVAHPIGAAILVACFVFLPWLEARPLVAFHAALLAEGVNQYHKASRGVYGKTLALNVGWRLVLAATGAALAFLLP